MFISSHWFRFALVTTRGTTPSSLKSTKVATSVSSLAHIEIQGIPYLFLAFLIAVTTSLVLPNRVEVTNSVFFK